MGVSGCGKTTIGAMLAGRLHWTFADADDFHPASNIDKMTAGRPLTDAEREPWLRGIATWIDSRIATGQTGVVTCSALKRRYRDQLRRPQVRFVYLHGSKDELARRLAVRTGHFFHADMLDSQLADLEEPTPDEHVLDVPISGTPDEIVNTILAALDG